MVSSTQSISNVSDFTTISQEEFNISTVNSTLPIQDGDFESQILLDYVVLPLSAIAILIILVGLIAFLIRKRR